MMLFLVVSSPRPEPPSAMVAARRTFWQWMQSARESGLIRHFFARAGRGGVAIVDVESHDSLHVLLNQWAELIPASFETWPLLQEQAALHYLELP